MAAERFKHFIALLAACGFLSCGSIAPASAWNLKTHLWIAQQVINDVIADGQVTIAGREYAVPPRVLEALRAHPDRYRMGSLGPDVFPDPIVGQTTVHPGIAGGWQSDDWLAHLLGAAKTPEEIAFAYGYVAHAAGDIFAHSYVNAYAGDIFNPDDKQRDVEFRHFVLEAYIGSLTPPPTDDNGAAIDPKDGLGTPSAFLRDTLIMGGEVSRQNLLAKSGAHLAAIYEVRRAVLELQKSTQEVAGRLAPWAAKHLEQALRLEAGLADGKAALATARAALAAEEAALKEKHAAYEAAMASLKAANKIVQDDPALIAANEQLLEAQAKRAADAATEAAKVADLAASATRSLDSEISELTGKYDDLVCELFVDGVLPECMEMKQGIKSLNDQIDVWENQQAAVERLRDDAESARDKLHALVDKQKGEYENAMKGVADKTHEATLLSADGALTLEESLVETRTKAVADAEAAAGKLAGELEQFAPVAGEIRKTIDRYTQATASIQKWLDDIDAGPAAYIEASHRAGLLILSSAGNPLKEYEAWFACYGQVFQPVAKEADPKEAGPKQASPAGCAVRDVAGDLAKEFEALIDGSPEIARWIVDPTRELKKRLDEKVKPVLATAAAKIAGFIAAPRTAEFLELLANPGNAARDRLIEVYRQDKSGKGLIAFTDVAAVVDKDLNIRGQYLAPETFAALVHSVTLAKLSLLAPDELNRLVKDLAGTRPSTSKPSGDVFPAHDGNFSLLLNAVRSIAGNQQWQAYGLPYPRKAGVALANPARFPYGEDGYKDRGKGLPIWTDSYLREKVFVALFPGGVLGALDERPELKWRNDRFPACAQHPYPQTQDPRTGRILSEDTTCVALPVPVVSAASERQPVPAVPAAPERPAAEPQAAAAPTATAQEFADRFFQCGKQIAGPPHWTVAGSYRIEDNARRKAAAIRQAYPDMTAEAWSPRGDSEFWTVMVAACTTSDRAQEARDLVVRRGIARDAFIWGPALAEGGARTMSTGN